MIKLFFKVWLDHIKLWWSKVRWFNKRKIESKECTEKVNSLTDIRLMCIDVDKRFEWTMDNIDQLFDSYRPTEYLYEMYHDSTIEKPFKDDCDGFHTVIYHILKQNGYKCALLTIATNPMKYSHTMTLFVDTDGRYCLVNYNAVHKYADGTTIQQIIDEYNYANGFKKEYFWTLHEYNYETKSFYKIDEKNFK